jgi:uncharacterized protein (TIGR04141 family)
VNRLALAVPSDCRDRFEFAESFSVALAGKSRQVGELDVDDLVGAVADKPKGQRLRALRQGRIQMFADTEGADRISRNVPVDHWLTAEVPDGVVHYFYWQGQWYEIGAEYLTVIESRIAELLARPSSVAMPPWPKGHGHDESWYNEEVAAQPGYLLLDKKTVHTGRFRGGGLEMADVLGPDGQFICVKKADKTAPLNHLFAQGRVAIETLRFDTEAREKFLAKLPPDHPVDPSFRSPTVVYGVMLKGRGTADLDVTVRLRQGLPPACGDRATGNGRTPGDRLHLSNELDGSGRVTGREDGVAVHSRTSWPTRTRCPPRLPAASGGPGHYPARSNGHAWS